MSSSGASLYTQFSYQLRLRTDNDVGFLIQKSTGTTVLLVDTNNNELDMRGAVIAQEYRFNTGESMTVTSGDLFFDGAKINSDSKLDLAASSYTMINQDIVRITVATTTLTLPASPWAGRKVVIVATVTPSNVTIQANTGQFIDDGVTTSIQLTTLYEHVSLLYDGTNTWLVV